MNQTEVDIAARLKGVYQVMRQLQANHNLLETRCIGAGNCCEIGLRVSLMECWNIAQSIKDQYWITAESAGIDTAKRDLAEVILDLKNYLINDYAEWDPGTEETPGHKCVFYSSDYGCGIYEVRPMVCRAYGVIAPVHDRCPRPRLKNNEVQIFDEQFSGPVLNEFDELIELWGASKPELDYSIHIAVGVLRFLLQEDEFSEFVGKIDSKFFLAFPGYKHQMRMRAETPVSIERK